MRLPAGIASAERLTAREIAALLGMSRKTVINRASQEDWPFEPVRANGGAIHEFRIDLLPGDIRDERRLLQLVRQHLLHSAEPQRPRFHGISLSVFQIRDEAWTGLQVGKGD